MPNMRLSNSKKRARATCRPKRLKGVAKQGGRQSTTLRETSRQPSKLGARRWSARKGRSHNDRYHPSQYGDRGLDPDRYVAQATANCDYDGIPRSEPSRAIASPAGRAGPGGAARGEASLTGEVASGWRSSTR